jgi:Na+/H+-dicarboxylate symporter
MEYFPFGVLALTIYNFSEYGAKLFIPYARIAICVIICVLSMMFVVYPLLILLFCRQNPYPVIFRLREAMLTAFLSRSSAATLPISMRSVEQHLGVSRSLTSFSLPLGATINMDGVCVHLPVFVILAANLMGVDITIGKMIILVISVTLASVGVGGIPGGSIFLLFAVLGHMGISPETSTLIVALAMGINPLLDMFETCCNVTGDMVCTYIIGKKNGLIEKQD